MNLPNRLTLSRLVLTLVFLIAEFSSFPYSETCALLVFGAASLTDYFDGKIARRDGVITSFGTLMDPLADKILTCSAFIAFVGRGDVAAWMVVVIVARELAITGLRLLAANQHVVLAAERYGKHKTISQIVAILAILVAGSYPEWGSWGTAFCGPWVPPFAEVTKWLAVILTMSSGGLYLARNRNLFVQDL